MRWIKRFCLFALLISVVSLLPATNVDSLAEYKLKSIWLYKICKFTFWPDAKNKPGPFVISVLGTLPAGNEISIPGKTIGKRKLVVRKIQKLEQIKKSNVLFIAPSEAHRIRTILDYIKGRSILTVGDTKGFAQKGVIINFYTSGKALRFEINSEAIKASKLQLHSQLFSIGTVVTTKTGAADANQDLP